MMLTLYHGTNDPDDIIKGNMLEGTWLAYYRFHAFRIAERRVAVQGGSPFVLEIESEPIFIVYFDLRNYS